MEDVREHTIYKAVSPDNGIHVKRIVELFTRSYGDTFPVRQVYTAEFWRSRIGNRLISFVAERGGKFVGHLAACPDRHNPKHVQVCVPAFDPELGGDTQEVARQLWQMIERVAIRQRWKAVYKFLISSLPEVEQLVGEIFGFSDIAIYPGCTVPQAAMRGNNGNGSSAGNGRQRLHPPVLVAERTFSDESEDDMTVFVPDYHAEMVKYLYQPLGLGRSFAAPDRKIAKSSLLMADAQAVETSGFPHSGVAHLFVQPSLLQQFSSKLFEFSGHQFDDYIVFANLFDSQTPAFCNFLEEQGLRFCGIVPLLRGRDNIVYARNCSGLLEGANFSSQRAQQLVKYIEEYKAPLKAKSNKKRVASKEEIEVTAESGLNER